MATLTTDQIIALAPDSASAKAGQGLALPRKWVSVGGNPRTPGVARPSPARSHQPFSGPELENLLNTYLLKNRPALSDVRVISFLVRIPRPWTETLSKRVLTEVQDDVSRYAVDYASRARWQNLLKKISLSVPPQLVLSTASWPKEIEANNVREVVDEFCAVIEFRRSIHRHFKEEK